MDEMYRLCKKLNQEGMDYRKVELSGENPRYGLMVEHNYDGPYPNADTFDVQHKVFGLAERYGFRAESRGYHTATLIYV